MKRVLTMTLALSALALGIVVLPASSGTVSAHERRQIEEYTFIVGFRSEPAYLNEPNGLDLRVFTVPEGVNPEEATEEQRQGVEGLEETLEAEVIFGGGAQTMTLELEPRFNEPGAYNGNFFPTAAGDYTYHIFGTVEDLEIDEEFSSGPETFSPINEVAPLQFPEKVQNNQELQAGLAALQADSGGESDDDSGTAIVLAIIALIVGAVGLAAGGYAAIARRS